MELEDDTNVTDTASAPAPHQSNQVINSIIYQLSSVPLLIFSSSNGFRRYIFDNFTRFLNLVYSIFFWERSHFQSFTSKISSKKKSSLIEILPIISKNMVQCLE